MSQSHGSNGKNSPAGVGKLKLVGKAMQSEEL